MNEDLVGVLDEAVHILALTRIRNIVYKLVSAKNNEEYDIYSGELTKEIADNMDEVVAAINNRILFCEEILLKECKEVAQKSK